MVPMIEIKVKPISINEAYISNGRRWKSDKYKSFKRSCAFLLPNRVYIPIESFYIIYEFGFSNTLSDYDGGLKNFQDVLQEKYNFDDRMILGAFVQKKKVNKGQEYIKFKIFAQDQKQEFLQLISEIIL